MASWWVLSMKLFQLRFRRVRFARLDVGENSRMRRTISEGRSWSGSVVDMVFSLAIFD